MKRCLAIVLIAVGCAACAWAAPAPLTSLRAIRALTKAQVSTGLPVDFEATVTYYRWYTRDLFVQDGDAAIYIYLTKDERLIPGDRVRIRGITRLSFRPIVESGDVTLLHHGEPPMPQPATYDQLISTDLDGRRVTVRATVRAADLIYTKNIRSAYLKMVVDGRQFDVTVEHDNGSALNGLLDAEVEVTGVPGAVFDSKMQQTGIILHASSISDVKVLRRAESSPWSLPITPMDQVLGGYRVRNESKRLRVHGTITYYQPGTAVVLQNGVRSIWIDTRTSNPLTVGDVADATGFAEIHDSFLNLQQGEIRDTGMRAPITPMVASWQRLTTNTTFQLGNIYDLVSIDAIVLRETREIAQDEYVLTSQGHLFTAIYRHSDRVSAIPLPPMKQIAPGSQVRVTGICIQMWSSQWNGAIPFDILLRSSDDITVLARPSLLNMRNLILMVGLLFLAMIAFAVRGWMLERKVRQQTAAMAKQLEAEAALVRRTSQLEQQRSRILEEINGSTPLEEILEQILAIISFMLNGAPCWCETSAGVEQGNRPATLQGLRVVEEKIRGRSEPILGKLFVALEENSPSAPQESEALSLGARMAALAIETRRLYSDLLRRSQFDMLTNIHNRFSFESHLDALMNEAQANACVFGLVYIDLDDFKQVNDVYGHQVGDLYLKEAARRMKCQLRSVDMLARLGGDEFAVVVPHVHGRADVEEIALRLERCFDETFTVDGYVMNLAGSIGFALYPDDATTKASLLSMADAAMYVAKKTRKQARGITTAALK
jgi:diguanylate cyclase (GGDEF)-like protein